MAKFGKQSLNSLLGVHPDMGRLMTESIKDTPIDFTITDGGRTAIKQHSLWLHGRDANGKVINASQVVTNTDGYKNKSNHQAKDDGYYYAVDLYAYYDGKIQFNDTKSLVVIAGHIKKVAKELAIDISWGGDWKATKNQPKGWDKSHFQLL